MNLLSLNHPLRYIRSIPRDNDYSSTMRSAPVLTSGT